MLIKNALECHKTLSDSLINRKMPFRAAEKIVDLLLELETQARKYNALHDRLLEQYGKPVEQVEGRYSIPAANVADFKRELEQLNAIEYIRPRQTIPIIEELTPQELVFLREFFNFESEPRNPSTESEESE